MQAIKVFVISLQKSTERRAHIKSQLDKQHIEFEFFDAIDGRVDDFPLFHQYDYFKRLWLTSGRMPSKGELGCYASHYSLWKKCIELNQPIIIIEDDAELVLNASNLLQNIAKFTTKFGFLRLETVDKGRLALRRKESSCSISYMYNNFGGLRAYSLSPEAACELVICEKWAMPVDNFVGSIYLHQVPSFLFEPSLVTNPQDFETTIQLGEERPCAWYRKPSRECYSLYRKIRMALSNASYCRK